jgi:hypothetical protein
MTGKGTLFEVIHDWKGYLICGHTGLERGLYLRSYMTGNLNLQTTVNGSVPYKIANIQPKVFMPINRHADVTLDEFLQRCTTQNFRFEVCERDAKNTLGIQYGLILIHKFCLIFFIRSENYIRICATSYSGGACRNVLRLQALSPLFLSDFIREVVAREP